MNLCKLKSIILDIKSYCRDNFKLIIALSLAFIAGLVIGILFQSGIDASLATESIEVVVSSLKMFLISVLYLLLIYFLILIFSSLSRMYWLVLIPYFVWGAILGRYVYQLGAFFGLVGVLNIVFAYLPFFLLSLVLFLVGGIYSIRYGACSKNCRYGLKTSFVALVKLFALNVAIAFVCFVIVGIFVDIIYF